MKTKTTNIKVTARDILNLDFNYYCNDKGLMSFNIDTAVHSGLSEIFLKNILECFGDYFIIGQSEYWAGYPESEYDTEYDEEEALFVVYHTNLPKDLFLEVAGKAVIIEDIHDIDFCSTEVERDEWSQNLVHFLTKNNII